MEIVTAIATASAAFKAIKTGFAAGRDVESMMSDLSRWMGALSDLDQAEREAKNPPMFKKLFSGQTVEQEALEVFAAKRKAQAQRDELRSWISAVLGVSAWNDLIKTEAQIRKQRQETLYRQREKRRKFMEFVFWILFGLIGFGILTAFVIFLLSLKEAQASLLKPEYVVCRLMACEKIDGSYHCIYLGANNTTDIVVYEPPQQIQRQIQCRYAPNNSRRPTLKETLDAIRDAL